MPDSPSTGGPSATDRQLLAPGHPTTRRPRTNPAGGLKSAAPPDDQKEPWTSDREDCERTARTADVNETTTTTVIFLTTLLGAGVAWAVLALDRGDLEWPAQSTEQVETPDIRHWMPGRPNFGGRTAFPEMLKDETAAPAPIPQAHDAPVVAAVGLGLAIAGLAWLLVEAFGRGVGWGCAVLFGNILGALAFMCAHPQRAWRPVLVQSAGWLTLLWRSVTAA